MATFEIAVYETKELHNRVGYRAQKRAKTYIRGAINRHSQHYAIVRTPSKLIQSPRQKAHSSFRAINPCEGVPTDYGNLGQWWDDYNDCHLSGARDVDLLLTAHDGQAGICTRNHYSVAEGGQNIANLPRDYRLWGCSRPYNSMQTALHEIAHGVLKGKVDGFREHKVGWVYKHGSTRSRTPNSWSKRYNECGNYVKPHDGCQDMRYSPCCADRMRHT